MVDISIVIPVFEEEGSLRELHAKISDVMKATGRSYEIIFVDDGSRDGSLEILESIYRDDPRITVLSFMRRYGKSAALAVGFDEAVGEVIITIDADLQDDPSEIPRLVEELEKGYDLISGWKKQRKDPISKTIPSKVFNSVTTWVTGLKLHDINCGLKAYRRSVTDQIKLYGELHRFLPVFAHKEGFRVGEIPVTHHPRTRGKTKYGMGRFLHGFLDLLTVILVTGYTRSPLHFFGTIGVVFTAVGFGINCYLTVVWLRYHNIQGRHPLLTLGVLLMILGFTLISTGLLAELITRMGHRGRKEYSLKKGLYRDEAKESRNAEAS
jgi:glycosyltransferase involved in cell wall biosynthesis